MHKSYLMLLGEENAATSSFWARRVATDVASVLFEVLSIVTISIMRPPNKPPASLISSAANVRLLMIQYHKLIRIQRVLNFELQFLPKSGSVSCYLQRA